MGIADLQSEAQGLAEAGLRAVEGQAGDFRWNGVDDEFLLSGKG